ncbi:MAG: beta strand repeat-containing protein, partial [Acidimicrobiales bacterium]
MTTYIFDTGSDITGSSITVDSVTTPLINTANNSSNLIIETGGGNLGGRIIISSTSQSTNFGYVLFNPSVAPAISNITTGNISAGTYNWSYTFLNSLNQETLPSPISINITPTFPPFKATITISIGNTNTVARNIYRSTNTGTAPYYLIYTLTDNITTSFIDNNNNPNTFKSPPTSNNSIESVITTSIQPDNGQLAINSKNANQNTLWLNDTNGLFIDAATFFNPNNATNDSTTISDRPFTIYGYSDGVLCRIFSINVGGMTLTNSINLDLNTSPTVTNSGPYNAPGGATAGIQRFPLVFNYWNGSSPLTINPWGISINQPLPPTTGLDIYSTGPSQLGAVTILTSITAPAITITDTLTVSKEVITPHITTDSTGTNLLLDTGNSTLGGQITIDASTPTTAITGALSVSNSASITGALTVSTTADITTSVTTGEVITSEITTNSITQNLLLETGNKTSGGQITIDAANPTTAITGALSVSNGTSITGALTVSTTADITTSVTTGEVITSEITTSSGDLTIAPVSASTAITGALSVSNGASITGALTVSTTADITTSVTTGEVITSEITTSSGDLT